MNTKNPTLLLILAAIAIALGVFMFGIFDQPAIPVWLSVTTAVLMGLFVFVAVICLEWQMPGEPK